ncbi:DUF4258 domain-containing protein [Methanoplanus limicola]|jgi:hypothetical protein|uniref:DUF4258 domain-containing protein n=1 Tax=Methanoplanus limicola DSM 2279 TaxID=937775 RepID=H1Z0V4_9EURY|nr:DUF4258 domain-containing protein [Methanoplanus limicola]EHQ36247.1 hypothetical protein Metlim_2178 [Methanoplanus limicola DSM 2279]
MPDYSSKINRFLTEDSFIISNHARTRMFERRVSTAGIIKLLMKGEIIEEYPDDEPCPSVLMLGYIYDQPYHLVTGICEDHLRIITVYLPDELHWINPKIRRKNNDS